MGRVTPQRIVNLMNDCRSILNRYKITWKEFSKKVTPKMFVDIIHAIDYGDEYEKRIIGFSKRLLNREYTNKELDTKEMRGKMKEAERFFKKY